MEWYTKEDIQEAKNNGIRYKLFYDRVYFRGWDIQMAKTTPPIPRLRSLYHKYKEVCEEHGISQGLFTERLARMTPEEAATMPKIKGKPRVIPLEILKLAEKNGITYSALRQRIYKLKLSHEEAATLPLQTDFNRKRINKKKRDRQPIIGFNTTKWRENV